MKLRLVHLLTKHPYGEELDLFRGYVVTFSKECAKILKIGLLFCCSSSFVGLLHCRNTAVCYREIMMRFAKSADIF